jgi:hypothetical protein
VISADPVIETMIVEVEKLLATYLSPQDLKELTLTITGSGEHPEQLDLIRNVAWDLRGSYQRLSESPGGAHQVEAAILTADGLSGTDDTLRLAVSALRSAETYRAAHRKLAENVTQQQSLRSSLEQVQALVNEVNEANKLKKKIEGNKE